MNPYQTGYPTDQSQANWSNYDSSGFVYTLGGDGSFQAQQQHPHFSLPWMQQPLHPQHAQHLQQQALLAQQLAVASDQQQYLHSQHQALFLHQQQLLQQPPSANFQYSLNYDQHYQATANAPPVNEPQPQSKPQPPSAKPIADVHATNQSQNATNANARNAPTFTSFAITAPMLNASLFNQKKKKTSVITSPPTVSATNQSTNNSNANMTPNKARKRVVNSSPPVIEGMLDDETIAIPPHLHSAPYKMDTFNNAKKTKFSATNPTFNSPGMVLKQNFTPPLPPPPVASTWIMFFYFP
jgi:hypothetical protein